ncbi:MAG: cytochrome c oxidase accessory protein CcoG [Candidatus Zixiibacteriota bacterium]
MSADCRSNSTAAERYRDRLTTADRRGRRIWMYPTSPRGKLHTARSVLAVFLLAFLFCAPLLRLNGEQLLLFSILKRKFVIFGLIFWPQDFHLFVLVAIAFVVFVVLFTVVFGRLFCGWICPQTIFMEMVFRKIEFLIEGKAISRRKQLDQRPLDLDKFLRKLAKHTIFFAISFLVGNTFLAYIIGIDELITIATDPPSQHLVGLSAMIGFSFLFYFVFGWFREQVCIMVCPYGRLQSVLLDSNSIAITYDKKRGEPRRPLAVGLTAESNGGDCIDCDACVRVCPTGIDIRNGTQLECINCTACIDACNRVMTRVSRPTGLIRYSSAAAIDKGEGFRFTSRAAGYSAVLAALLVIVFVLMLNRTDIEAMVLRTPGTLYEQLDNGRIRNLYSLKLVNKTGRSRTVEIRLKQPNGSIMLVGELSSIEPQQVIESAFFVDIDTAKLFTTNNAIVIEVYVDNEFLKEVRASFLAPIKRSGQ